MRSSEIAVKTDQQWHKTCLTEGHLSRKLMMRIGHVVGFEAGLIFATVPVLMWILQLDPSRYLK
ncbi:MAG: chlorhexidine efflux transporter [Moritella sp.]|uniref:chlorhexidine efflux transporter n=1 Tax=Moritella sp. TaxID=78556 RepID=UPI0029A9B268|nr:chlorhexidine efflux transporter [Moritella sp.]MDX2322194.1 chlorhexidine efflux transporter [Moritella sp.]